MRTNSPGIWYGDLVSANTAHRKVAMISVKRGTRKTMIGRGVAFVLLGVVGLEEGPSWTPPSETKHRLANIPDFVAPGPHNPMGARALYLFEGSRDTLYRIHGTNQPEYIGHAISSGCIRMTNEDVIDLFNRVKMGAIVVTLGPRSGESRVATADPRYN